MTVEGEAPAATEDQDVAIVKKKKAEPRPLSEILGDPKRADEEPDPSAGPMYNPIRLEQFLRGQITLGDLEGITKQEQYEMAKIGFSYLTSGKLAQAKTVFEGLLALDPFDAYFHTALGSIAQQENQLPEAEKRYTRALEINPFSPVAFANRGEVRIAMGKLGEGSQDLVRALEEDPGAQYPSTLRARATIQVVRDNLASMNLPPLPENMRLKPAPKPPTAGGQPKKAAPTSAADTTIEKGSAAPKSAADTTIERGFAAPKSVADTTIEKGATAPKSAADTTIEKAATNPKVAATVGNVAPGPAKPTVGKPVVKKTPGADDEVRAPRKTRPPPRRPGKK